MPFFRYGNYKFKEINIRYRRGTHDLKTLKETYECRPYICKIHPLSDTAVVIDVGAFIGDFAILAATLARSGTVFAIEPFEGSYKLCEYNVRKNNLKNIKLLNLGIAGNTSDRELFLSYNEGGHSLLVNPDKTKFRHKTSKIFCVDLNTFFSLYDIKKCDLLKMDCEGSEYEILESLKPETWEKINNIVLEYHELESTPLTVDRLVKVLKKNNFVIEKIEKHQNFPTGYMHAFRNKL